MRKWNLKLWIALYLPPFLGTKKMVSWLAALLKPANSTFLSFLSFQKDFNDGLRYNSQSIVLEAFLNNKFDSDQRRLRVINQELVFVPRYHYSIEEHEQNPALSEHFYFFSTVAHSPYYCYFSNERESAMYSFLVSFPVGMLIDLNAVRAAVNFRKFASLRYKLVRVEADLLTPIEFLTQDYE